MRTDEMYKEIGEVSCCKSRMRSVHCHNTAGHHSTHTVMISPRMLVTLSILLAGRFLLHAQNDTLTYYVSRGGNDSWSGRFPSANSTQTDGPFATMERARAAVDEPTDTAVGAVAVYVRKGVYGIRETMEVKNGDRSPLLWSAFPGEQVTLSGGTTLKNYVSLRSEPPRWHVAPRLLDSIVVIDLRNNGVMDFGQITAQSTPGMELFFRGNRMPVARWPNDGWVRIADVPQTGDTLYNEGLEREKRFDNVPVGRHYGRITYSGDRPDRWSPEDEIMIHGYWTWDWSDSYQRVQSIDTLKKEITIAPPHHHYGYTKNQRYYFLNIPEEIDTPGEWYLDRSQGLLYFWPPDAIRDGDLVVSMTSGPLVRLDSASNVTLQGFDFEYGRGGAVEVVGGHGNRIAGCTIRNLGGLAVIINGGTDNGVQSCDISDLALGAITIRGGDRKTLTPGKNFADNNHIHHWSRWMRTGQYAIRIDDVGNSISHNLIHDAPFEGIYLRGNEHRVEYNEIHHVTQETGDAGALHTGRDWTWRGNIIRYNYFHDLVGPGLHGVMAVYLDDWSSGFTVYGNVFTRAGRAAFIGGGRDNIVENNIFVDCAPSVHVDARGLGWAGYYFTGKQELITKMEEMNYRKPPYSLRYPELLTLYQDDPAVPKHNKILHNVSAGGRWMDVYDFLAFDFSVVTVKDNVIADPIVLRRRADGQKGWDPYYLNIDMQEGYLALRNGDRSVETLFRGNLITTKDPGFVDARAHDFRLKPDSPAFQRGFIALPIDSMGLYTDRWRSR